jgi:hypothetical protein
MLKENIAFTGVLTTYASKAKEENVIVTFNIRHQMEGEIQTFLDSYADKCSESNIRSLFQMPVQWKSIVLEAAYKFTIVFEDLELQASLKAIKVRRRFVKDTEIFVYDLVFEKELEENIDLILPTYLNQKETDEESGKKSLILYSVWMTPIEAEQKA